MLQLLIAMKNFVAIELNRFGHTAGVYVCLFFIYLFFLVHILVSIIEITKSLLEMLVTQTWHKFGEFQGQR